MGETNLHLNFLPHTRRRIHLLIEGTLDFRYVSLKVSLQALWKRVSDVTLSPNTLRNLLVGSEIFHEFS